MDVSSINSIRKAVLIGINAAWLAEEIIGLLGLQWWRKYFDFLHYKE